MTWLRKLWKRICDEWRALRYEHLDCPYCGLRFEGYDVLDAHIKMAHWMPPKGSE
jgi:hypothetical protein